MPENFQIPGHQGGCGRIGPGLVPRETALNAVSYPPPQLGISVDQFFELNKGALLSVEEAGMGFAASIVFAQRFRGQEISSLQAIKAADINFGSRLAEDEPVNISVDKWKLAQALCEAVRVTLKEQSEGWKGRLLFERQRVRKRCREIEGKP